MAECPLCCKPLRLVIESGIDIDVCDECNGVWLDAGELDSIGDSRKFATQTFTSAELSSFRCPRCKIREFARIETKFGNVALCTQCKGIFVDGDMLDVIAKTERSRLPSNTLVETMAAGPDLMLATFEVLWMFGNH